MLGSIQKHNGEAVILAVFHWCDLNERRAHYLADRRVRHRLARIAITCCLTESELLNYANAGIPISLQLPHDAVGTDHGSVGLIQQQVGVPGGEDSFGWGNVYQCMNLTHAVFAFLDRLFAQGLASWDGPDLWNRIQSVQVSYDPTGHNYEVNMGRSRWFLRFHFNKLYKEHELNRHRAYRNSHKSKPKGTNRVGAPVRKGSEK